MLVSFLRKLRGFATESTLELSDAWHPKHITEARGIQNSLGVRVSATLMGRCLGLKFSKQGSFLVDFPLTWVGLGEGWQFMCIVLNRMFVYCGYSFSF